MRKACIDLNDTLKIASLLGGDLGGGKCLHTVNLLDGSNQMKMLNLSTNPSIKEPTPEEWAAALNQCLDKAEELKYEVSRVRGRSLTES
ncbi:hypothetical protein [Marinomonas transparens]|uniref:Uncharacterized protein n=1 Tax=Marinomonas transparens TaxID=2795388 RepID=A0A934JSF4_9GAMM|nr:hypothetical protein [Marinomonas transparens]MBJ7539878.1 hypothetical protein [Marinomonas transparens]